MPPQIPPYKAGSINVHLVVMILHQHAKAANIAHQMPPFRVKFPFFSKPKALSDTPLNGA